MRIRWTGALVVAAVLLFMGGSRQAHAQDYAQQVWSQLQAMKNSEYYRGYDLVNYVIGQLPEGRTDSWTFGLAANKTYIIGGACDTDCSDLDIVVKDAAGNVIAKDDTDDDVPIVRFTTRSAGRFTIEVKMYDCNTSTCYFGFSVFRQ